MAPSVHRWSMKAKLYKSILITRSPLPQFASGAWEYYKSGPSCSKLMMSLINDSLKFTSRDMQICWNFLLKKMWVAFATQKLLTFFSAKNIRILCIEAAKTINEMTLNELVKLTTLWTTGPCTTRTKSPGIILRLVQLAFLRWSFLLFSRVVCKLN